MVGDIGVDELQGIGVELGKEPAGVESGFFAQAPAQLGGDQGQWRAHTGQPQFNLRASIVGEQAADFVGVEPLQAEALGTQVGGEKPGPALGVGIGNRQIDHPMHGYARIAPAAG